MNNMHVLIVEDNISTALDIEMILNDLGGFTIDRAHSLQEIERQLTLKAYDLILADILLGGKSSLPLLKERRPNTPIIVMTNNYSSEYYDDSLSLNAHAYLVKPVNPVSLKFEIDRIYQKKVDDESKVASKVIIKDGQKVNLVSPEEIIWIKTEGNYSTIKTILKKIVIKKSQSKILEILNTDGLFRTHRSTIIQLSQIDSIDLKTNNVTMRDGEVMPLSKAYRQELAQELGDRYKKLI